MSEEVSVISDIEGVDADMDWDNIEDVAPSMETQSEENNGSETEEENPFDSSEDLDTDSENDSEDVTEEQPDNKEGEEEDNKDAKKTTDEEDAKKEELELPEPLVAQGLVSKEGEIGKMVKIDGEEVFVNLKELGNDYSGNQAVAKRFNEFNIKEQEFKKEMEDVNEYITDLGATMRDSSIMEGVAKIGELVGFPPHVLKEALIKEIAPELERRYGLSEEEISLEQKNLENEYLKKQLESDNSRLQQEQAQRELESKVVNLREAHNINSEEWKELESTLLANNYKKEEVTPELVVQFKGFRQAESRAESVLKEFDSNYLENKEVVDTLVDILFDEPDLSDEDVNEILRDALGESKKENAEEKVKKALETKETKQTKKPETKVEPKLGIHDGDGDEILDWEDLL